MGGVLNCLKAYRAAKCFENTEFTFNDHDICTQATQSARSVNDKMLMAAIQWRHNVANSTGAVALSSHLGG